jgi:hypothetical protein
MRVSNTNEKNITYDSKRGRYRVEMRVGSLGSRTARLETLAEAIVLRDAWAGERDRIVRNDKESIPDSPVFSIEYKPVLVHFD